MGGVGPSFPWLSRGSALKKLARQARHRARQLKFQQESTQLGHRPAAALLQAVERDRVKAHQLQDLLVLRWCVGTLFLRASARMRRGIQRRQFFQHVLCVFDQLGALSNQGMAAAG